MQEGGRDGSIWWREIAGIHDGFGVVGAWFVDNLRRNVGNGATTLLSLDIWVGNVPLWDMFRRLFKLSDTKMSSVAQMFALGWGKGGEVWKWKRRLWAWEEEMVEECRALLLTISFQGDTLNAWSWFPEPTVGYSDSGAYCILSNRTPPHDFVPSDLLWRKDVPVKVSMFVWLLFRNRLPTKGNLFRRGILSQESQLCVGGCGLAETSHLLFLGSSFFGSIWHLVRLWLGVPFCRSVTDCGPFLQFGILSGYTTSKCLFMLLIWFATSWVIWKERNDMIFHGQENAPIQLLENIKLLFFWWFKVIFAVFPYQFYTWCRSPFLCLGTGN